MCTNSQHSCIETRGTKSSGKAGVKLTAFHFERCRQSPSRTPDRGFAVTYMKRSVKHVRDSIREFKNGFAVLSDLLWRECFCRTSPGFGCILHCCNRQKKSGCC